MYHLGDWDISDDGRNHDDMLQNGNRLLTGNGCLGRRGVVDEAPTEDMPATIVSGLYDRYGDLWREPVNAPDPLFLSLSGEDRTPLRIGDADLLSHEQALNFRYGIYSRKTSWRRAGTVIRFEAERFADMASVHRLCARYRLWSDRPVRLRITQGINVAVRDLNGPHLGDFSFRVGEDGALSTECVTLEKGIPLAVVSINSLFYSNTVGERQESDTGVFFVYTIDLDGKQPLEFVIYGAVYSGLDLEDGPMLPGPAALKSTLDAYTSGWGQVLADHKAKWDHIWQTGDVIIEGDDYAQRCLRYSLYHLHIIVPRHRLDSCGVPALSVPARGLSGQTYKGAIFWDTEMFVSPYFLATEPALAAQFIRYRIETLPGAKRKAAEYGYRGAFYAWESQETGDDACTDFNVTDVFTGRPVRTYFRDKQIHISADIVYAIKKYIDYTGDREILTEGGMEVILESARFFLSYLYYSPEHQRCEILDVIGPDEYHERVHNNAFTNRIVLSVFETTRDYIAFFRKTHPDFIENLIQNLYFEDDLAFLEKAIRQLYIPGPNSDNVIEQFDGYFRLEDCSLDTVRSRLKDPREYWGGGTGVATATRIIKQADVVTMLVLFGGDYSVPVKKANLEFYESRTEHGSSLSACMYALLACETGGQERAYPYFIKSAEIDITGQGKHFAGLVYIGGTHPAANGGAWMVAVQGFCGFSIVDGEIKAVPRLPTAWKKVVFSVTLNGTVHEVTVTHDHYHIRKVEDK
ncbi:glycosyl hydrolase [Spirochaetia bacterium]|nr:glycosyl hydrolase [Spirochaetia bacterium]